MYQFATQEEQDQQEPISKLPNENDVYDHNNDTDNNSIDVNDFAVVVENGSHQFNNSATSSLSAEEVTLNDVDANNNISIADDIKKPSRRRKSAVDAFIKQNSIRSLASTDTISSYRTATSRCRSVMDDDDDDTNFSALRAPTRRLSAEHTTASSRTTSKYEEVAENVIKDGVVSTIIPKNSSGMQAATTTTVLDDEGDNSNLFALSAPSKILSSGSNNACSQNEDGIGDGSDGSSNVDSASIADSSTMITDVITNVTTKTAPTVVHEDDSDATTFTAQNITATNSAIMSSNDDGIVDINVDDDDKEDKNIDKEESSNIAENEGSRSNDNNNGSNGISMTSFQPFLSAFSLSLQQLQASSMSTIRSSLPSPNKKSNREVDNDNFEDSPPPPPRTKTREELGALHEVQKERQRIEMELLRLQMREEEEKRKLKIKEQQEEILRQCANGNVQQEIYPKERDPNQRPPNSSRSQKYTNNNNKQLLKQPKKQQHQQQQEMTPPSKNLEGASSSDMLLSSMFNQIQQGALSLFPFKNSGDLLLRNSCTSIDDANGLESIREIDEEDLDDDSSVGYFSRKNSLKALMQLKNFGSTSMSSLMKQPLKESQEEVFPSATATLVSTMDYKFPPKSPTNSFNSHTTKVFATVLPAFFHVDEDENPSPYGTANAAAPPTNQYDRRRRSVRGFYLARERSEELKKKFGGYWFWIQIFVAFLFLAAIFGLLASLLLVSNRFKSHNDSLQTITSSSAGNSDASNNGGGNTLSNDFNGNNNNQSHNHNEHSPSSYTLSLPVIEGIWKDVAEPLRYDHMNLEYMYGHALSDDGTILALTGRTVAPSGDVDDTSLKINGVFIRVFQQRDGFWHPVGSDISDILQNNELMLEEDDGYFSCWSLDMNSDGTIIAFGTTTITNITSNTNSNSHFTPKASSTSSQKRQQSVTSNVDGAVGILQKVHVYQFDGKEKEWNTKGNTVVVDSISLKEKNNSERMKQSIAISDDGQTLVVGTTVHFLRGNGSNSNPTSRLRRHGKALNGNVRVYKHNIDGGWRQFGQTLTGFESGDQFGWDVDVSANGAVIAVGATQQSFLEEDEKEVPTKEEEKERDSNFFQAFIDEHTTNDKKSNTGYACVFELNDGSNQNNDDKILWKIRGKDLFGIEHNDKFGWSISLSKDGNTLAVGAPHSTPTQIKDHTDDLLKHPGQVYVFYYTGRSDHKRRRSRRVLQQSDIYEWVYDGTVLSGAHSYDNFGSWVDLSARGDVLIVAAHLYKNGANPYYQQMNGYAQIYTRIISSSNDNDWYRIGSTLMSMKDDDIDVSNNNNAATTTTSLKNACGIIVSISADGTVITTGTYPSGSTNLKVFIGG